MGLSLIFARLLFGILSLFFMVTYMISYPVGSLSMRVLTGVCLGGTFSLFLMGVETFFRRFTLKIFNTAALGLFFGYLMGQACVLIFNTVVEIGALGLSLHSPTIDIMKISMFLFGIYLGYVLTLRFSEEIHLNIPFVKFQPASQKKKDLIIDLSALYDHRFSDFCSSGILNHQLILPKYLIKHLQVLQEQGDEIAKLRSKKTLDVIRKIEAMPNLSLRISEIDFAEVLEISQKTIRLARLLDANVLLSDGSRSTPSEDIQFVNLHILSQCLKPLTPPGENITIKVQRFGKEPKQGVGYLEDGTMVVINNGGEYVGEIIDTQVISVKQTSAGRIIFTNALVDEHQFPPQQIFEHQHAFEHQHE